MFTGLVADKGEILNLDMKKESALITIKSKLLTDVRIGDSISVNGVCLTVISKTRESFQSDVMVQTLKLTSLGNLKVGDPVNLELAMAANSRMGGHFVQGHVDGIATVKENSIGEKWNMFVIEIPKELAKYVVNQGSITVDGVSLTVGSISENEVTLWLIPETLAKTNLSSRIPGNQVNVEVDILAKYVERLMKAGKDE
ncbi:MAG: riboflavin synthase [Actinomycetales bacterium]